MKKSIHLFTYIYLLMAAGFSLSAQAQEKPFQEFGEHKVYYSVFNSSFIKPDIARVYNITRGKDRALINIAVTQGSEIGGIAAQVQGTASNLMQQQKKLEFFEIKEPNAVYYLASIRFTNEEVFNFSIQVKPNGSARPYTVEFTKTLYVEK